MSVCRIGWRGEHSHIYELVPEVNESGWQGWVAIHDDGRIEVQSENPELARFVQRWLAQWLADHPTISVRSGRTVQEPDGQLKHQQVLKSILRGTPAYWSGLDNLVSTHSAPEHQLEFSGTRYWLVYEPRRTEVPKD